MRARVLVPGLCALAALGLLVLLLALENLHLRSELQRARARRDCRCPDMAELGIPARFLIRSPSPAPAVSCPNATSPAGVHRKATPSFSPKSRYQVLVAEALNAQAVFSEGRLYDVSRLSGATQLEFRSVQKGVQALSGDRRARVLHCVCRRDPLRGVEYTVDALVNGRRARYHLLRPFAPVAVDDARTSALLGPGTGLRVVPRVEPVLFVIPLRGRTSVFRKFAERLKAVQARVPLVLHIVLHIPPAEGAPARADPEAEIAGICQANHLTCRVIVTQQPFARGRALRLGVETLNTAGEPNPLLFFCDVDMLVTIDFLRRCRSNAVAGRQIYFPMAFSYYRGAPWVLAVDNGKWRRYGLGMVCIHRNDYFQVGGFDNELEGWGEEDVHFYQSAVASGIEVLRAAEPGLQHLWHPKVCRGAKLSELQLRHCRMSQMEFEGDKKAIGSLALRQAEVLRTSCNLSAPLRAQLARDGLLLAS